MSPEVFFEEMTSFEKIFFLFLSLIAKISDFWHETFAWFYKLKFKWTQDFFRGKECTKENLNTWFFPKLEGKTAPMLVNFFWRFLKRQSMTAEELLEEKVKVEINFDSLCHKFLTWVSFLLSTSPGEPFEEEIVSINYFSPTFFRAGNFSDFWGSFFGKAAR